MTRALLLCLTLLMSTSTYGQGIPIGQMKMILNATQGNWIHFRDYNGRQLIYFTHLESYTCGIRSVSYSLNSDKLDKTWELQICNPDNPNAIIKDKPYLDFPLDTVDSIAVRLIYTDGSYSPIVSKSP